MCIIRLLTIVWRQTFIYDNIFLSIMTVDKIITDEDIKKITQSIDSLQKYLESNISQKEKQITAMILSKKYSDLEELSHEYNVFTKELTIIL